MFFCDVYWVLRTKEPYSSTDQFCNALVEKKLTNETLTVKTVCELFCVSTIIGAPLSSLLGIEIGNLANKTITSQYWRYSNYWFQASKCDYQFEDYIKDKLVPDQKSVVMGILKKTSSSSHKLKIWICYVVINNCFISIIVSFLNDLWSSMLFFPGSLDSIRRRTSRLASY